MITCTFFSFDCAVVIQCTVAQHFSNFTSFKHSSLCRVGGVGKWKNVFSEEQSKEVDAVFEKLEGTGVQFVYSIDQ